MAKKEVTTTDTQNQNLFTQLYTNSKDKVAEQNLGLTERSLRRKLESMYDDAESKINSIEQQINIERAKLCVTGTGTQNIINMRAEIEALEKAMLYINREYIELFGEPIVEVVDEV